MIRVTPKNAPSDFDVKVRQPGLTFLQSHGIVAGPVPAKFQWKELWQHALEDLYDDYDQICAYSCMRIEYFQGGASVDHFQHKHQFPMLAYEWSNYRLASSRFNSLKRTSSAILDPFLVQDGWFEIDFRTGKVIANPQLQGSNVGGQVETTIAALKLNRARFRKKRIELFNRAMETNPKKKVGMDILAEDAPFIYREIIRQGFEPK